MIILIRKLIFFSGLSFKGSSWISLGYGSGGSWNIQTKVDLHIRNDTHKPNFSPISTSRAIYRYVEFHTLSVKTIAIIFIK